MPNPETTKRRGLMSVLDMSPDQITRAEWRGVGETLSQARKKFADIGHGRQTWMDWAIALCADRGKELEEINATTRIKFVWHDDYKGLTESCLFVSGIFAGRVEPYSWPDQPDQHYIAWTHNNTGKGTCTGTFATIEQARDGLVADIKRLISEAESGNSHGTDDLNSNLRSHDANSHINPPQNTTNTIRPAPTSTAVPSTEGGRRRL